MKNIAVIGATGMLGNPVAKRFSDAGYNVTLLARDSKKAFDTFGPGFKLVTGDLQDVDSLKRLLSGQDELYLNLSVDQKSKQSDFQPEREGLANVLRAAQGASIKRIGYISSLVQFYQGQNGFNWWVFEIKRNAVAQVKDSGIPYSIFYPSTFMENFDKGEYIQGNKIILVGESKYKMHFVSGIDYAKQVVKAFQLPDGRQEYVVQGLVGYTANEAAEVFLKRYSRKKLKISRVPIGILKVLGAFSRKINFGAHIIEALNNYPEKFEAEKTWVDLGKPEVTLEDYISRVSV
ncbi:MAG: SDR family oxidoreductase [Bacteriovoracia bacterium]